jgi:transketolase
MAQFILPDRASTREMRYHMGFALADLARENDRVVALDADLRSSTGLHIFEHFFPDRLVKCGIAEQNMVAMAAGFAQEGYIPFPCTFDSFSRRFMDQLYVSVAYGNLDVKFLGAYAGLFTGKAGATHQSDKELSFLLRVPNLRVIEPGCIVELEQAMRCAAETPGPFYLRIVRCEVEPDGLPEGTRFQLGRGVTVLDRGSDVGLVCTGYLLGTARIAAEKLTARGIGVRVDHHPCLKPFDRGLLLELAAKVDGIVTMENHCTSGGLYSLVAETLAANGIGVPVAAVGTDPEDFIHTGHVNDLLDRYAMTSDHVADTAVALLERRKGRRP